MHRIVFHLLLNLIQLSLISYCKSEVSSPPLSSSNGVIKLIIKTYINEILKTNELNEAHVRGKLLKLSDHIVAHPALHQKYLWVGSKPPMDYDPDKVGIFTDASDVRKRNSETKQYPSEEICKTNRQWEQINSTHDFYDNQVQVVQEADLQQFVFSYRCASQKDYSSEDDRHNIKYHKGPCIGISPLYHSECAERNGWMYMFYKQKNNKTPQWGYVSAPHHCACKIHPKFVPTQSPMLSSDEDN